MSIFSQTEEEILSRNHPKEWEKIELSFICYQKVFNAKADHFNLKSSDAIIAFVAKCKKKRMYNCVYILQNKLKENK